MNKPAANHLPTVLRKRTRSWDGLRLVHYRLGAGETAAMQNKEHLIVLSLDGNCKSELRTTSGFRASNCNQGGVCIIPSGHPYSAKLRGESEHLAILLDPSLVRGAATELPTAAQVDVIESSAPRDAIIRSVGLALLSELESEGPGGRLYVESLANVLAVHLLRHYTASRNGGLRLTGGLSGQKLRLVLDFIAANYGRDLTLSELAAVADMSTFHFAREFKRATGKTPHRYLMKFRIDRAKEMLVESQIPIVEVGLRSGFSHQSHFTRLFHKVAGTTPRSYRLMFQT